MGPVAHWDEAPSRSVDRSGLRALWTDLGAASGSVRVGARRIQLAEGDRPTPPHAHGAEEEIFYVLAGEGLSWQDGRTCRVRAGDCLVHRIVAEAHTLIAGAGGLDVLVFGMRVPVEACVLPRAGAAWLGPSWVEVGGPDPWARDHAAGPLEVPEPSERPASVVHIDDVPVREVRRGASRFAERKLSAGGGSQWTGLRHVVVEPGGRSWPAHCHSSEEELFVVLDGEGRVLVGEQEHPVRAGHVVSRPAGTGVAHQFAAGERGLTYLAYGTREPGDVSYFPRSGKVFLRGIGVIGRLEPLDYWDGEE